MLQWFPFTTERKRTTVVMRYRDVIWLFCKVGVFPRHETQGADSTVFPLLSPDSPGVKRVTQYVDQCAQRALRTYCLAILWTVGLCSRGESSPRASTPSGAFGHINVVSRRSLFNKPGSQPRPYPSGTSNSSRRTCSSKVPSPSKTISSTTCSFPSNASKLRESASGSSLATRRTPPKLSE